MYEQYRRVINKKRQGLQHANTNMSLVEKKRRVHTPGYTRHEQVPGYTGDKRVPGYPLCFRSGLGVFHIDLVPAGYRTGEWEIVVLLSSCRFYTSVLPVNSAVCCPGTRVAKYASIRCPKKTGTRPRVRVRVAPSEKVRVPTQRKQL